jgi:hypothetical protein
MNMGQKPSLSLLTKILILCTPTEEFVEPKNLKNKNVNDLSGTASP